MNSRTAAVCSFNGISDDEDAAGDTLPPLALVFSEDALPNVVEPPFLEEGGDLTSMCQGESDVALVISFAFISICSEQQPAVICRRYQQMVPAL